MILYHGSYLPVEKPDIAFSRDNIDFGKGFYTTPFKDQATRWAERFLRTQGQAWVSIYELHEQDFFSRASVLEFTGYTKEWLDCIMRCRRGGSVAGDYDAVIGGVANDKVFNSIELFIEGLINEDEVLQRLRYDRPNKQYCFRSQWLIDACLTFLSCESVHAGK